MRSKSFPLDPSAALPNGSQMGIVIEREIPAPASEVLAAIARAGEWRESAIPGALKQGAIVGIDVRVNGSRFRWYYARTWYPAQSNFIELWGRVEESPDGASRVVARCGYDRGWTGMVIGAGVIGLLMAFSGEGLASLALPGIAVGSAITAFAWNSRAASGRDLEANYLVERLEHLLDAFTMNGVLRAPAK